MKLEMLVVLFKFTVPHVSKFMVHKSLRLFKHMAKSVGLYVCVRVLVNVIKLKAK